MNTKYLDSCIQILKGMRGDQSNELESGQQRALGREMVKLKRLKKQQNPDHDEVYRLVAGVALAVSEICGDSRSKRKSRS